MHSAAPAPGRTPSSAATTTRRRRLREPLPPRIRPPVDHHPDRPHGLVADRRQAMRHRRVEGDRVVLADFVVVEADAHAERSAEHVAELPATVPYEGSLVAR